MVDDHSPEHLSIRLWRGYVSAVFYARPDGADVALYTSSSFRTLRYPWERRGPLAERGQVALDVLVERLTASGWQIEERRPGAAWYELEFRQPRKRARPPRRERAAVSEKTRN